MVDASRSRPVGATTELAEIEPSITPESNASPHRTTEDGSCFRGSSYSGLAATSGSVRLLLLTVAISALLFGVGDHRTRISSGSEPADQPLPAGLNFGEGQREVIVAVFPNANHPMAPLDFAIAGATPGQHVRVEARVRYKGVAQRAYGTRRMSFSLQIRRCGGGALRSRSRPESSLLAVSWPCVLAVNWAQRAPIGAKDAPFVRGSNDRSYWGSLGDVAASTRLITQRSLVQIQPPQPLTTRGWRTQEPLTPLVYPDFTQELNRESPVPSGNPAVTR